MRKLFTTIIFVLLILKPCVIFASLELSAKSAVLIDGETGRVIYSKNSDEKLPMASTTKIITALTAINNGNLSDVVTVSETAATTEGSSVWLSAGEKLKLSELLYALMLESGNDASVAIAEHVGGSVTAFSEMMNELCKQAGAFSTNCVTPSGLDDELHYTTAGDLAKIARLAMQSDVFREIVSTYKTTIPWEGNDWDRTLVNHNKLLNIYEGADGIKTGYTKKSGRCLVSSAEKDGWRLIAVTLNAPDDWNDHVKMLDYGFENFKEEEILIQPDTILGKIPAPGSKLKDIAYRAKEVVKIKKLSDNINYRFDIKIPKEISLPLGKDEKIGSLDIYIDENFYKSVDLYTLENAEQDDYKYIFGANFKKLLKTLLYLVR